MSEHTTEKAKEPYQINVWSFGLNMEAENDLFDRVADAAHSLNEDVICSGGTAAVTQYGVQVVWADPVEAGAVKPGEEYVPRWLHFETEEQADAFASIYVTKLEAGPHNGVAAVNRATRWAVERYGPWEPPSDNPSSPASTGAPCGSCGAMPTYTIILGGKPMPACLRHLNHWRTPSLDYTCPTTCVEKNHPGREHDDWLSEFSTPPGQPTDDEVIAHLDRVDPHGTRSLAAIEYARKRLAAERDGEDA